MPSLGGGAGGGGDGGGGVADEAGSETDSIESIYKQLSAPRKVSVLLSGSSS